MKDFGLLILRLTVGGLMAGHGAQKLFGWFGGYGLKGTAGWLESMNMKPGKPWAVLAGASEFGGGLLTLLGFLNPLGPLGTIGAMGMATAKVHWGKPIWVTSGGAELPVVNIASALALALAGPGKFSLDRATGVRLPRRLILFPGIAIAAVGVAMGVMTSTQAQQEQAQDQPQDQAQIEDQLPAVPVAASPETQDQAGQMVPDEVAGTELQAGEDAAQPV